jgi:hypothetical protein
MSSMGLHVYEFVEMENCTVQKHVMLGLCLDVRVIALEPRISFYVLEETSLIPQSVIALLFIRSQDKNVFQLVGMVNFTETKHVMTLGKEDALQIAKESARTISALEGMRQLPQSVLVSLVSQRLVSTAHPSATMDWFMGQRSVMMVLLFKDVRRIAQALM